MLSTESIKYELFLNNQYMKTSSVLPYYQISSLRQRQRRQQERRNRIVDQNHQDDENDSIKEEKEDEFKLDESVERINSDVFSWYQQFQISFDNHIMIDRHFLNTIENKVGIASVIVTNESTGEVIHDYDSLHVRLVLARDYDLKDDDFRELPVSLLRLYFAGQDRFIKWLRQIPIRQFDILFSLIGDTFDNSTLPKLDDDDDPPPPIQKDDINIKQESSVSSSYTLNSNNTTTSIPSVVKNEEIVWVPPSHIYTDDPIQLKKNTVSSTSGGGELPKKHTGGEGRKGYNPVDRIVYETRIDLMKMILETALNYTFCSFERTLFYILKTVEDGGEFYLLGLFDAIGDDGTDEYFINFPIVEEFKYFKDKYRKASELLKKLGNPNSPISKERKIQEIFGFGNEQGQTSIIWFTILWRLHVTRVIELIIQPWKGVEQEEWVRYQLHLFRSSHLDILSEMVKNHIYTDNELIKTRIIYDKYPNCHRICCAEELPCIERYSYANFNTGSELKERCTLDDMISHVFVYKETNSICKIRNFHLILMRYAKKHPVILEFTKYITKCVILGNIPKAKGFMSLMALIRVNLSFYDDECDALASSEEEIDENSEDEDKDESQQQQSSTSSSKKSTKTHQDNKKKASNQKKKAKKDEKVKKKKVVKKKGGKKKGKRKKGGGGSDGSSSWDESDDSDDNNDHDSVDGVPKKKTRFMKWLCECRHFVLFLLKEFLFYMAETTQCFDEVLGLNIKWHQYKDISRIAVGRCRDEITHQTRMDCNKLMNWKPIEEVYRQDGYDVKKGYILISHITLLKTAQKVKKDCFEKILLKKMTSIEETISINRTKFNEAMQNSTTCSSEVLHFICWHMANNTGEKMETKWLQVMGMTKKGIEQVRYWLFCYYIYDIPDNRLKKSIIAFQKESMEDYVLLKRVIITILYYKRDYVFHLPTSYAIRQYRACRNTLRIDPWQQTPALLGVCFECPGCLKFANSIVTPIENEPNRVKPRPVFIKNPSTLTSPFGGNKPSTATTNQVIQSKVDGSITDKTLKDSSRIDIITRVGNDLTDNSGLVHPLTSSIKKPKLDEEVDDDTLHDSDSESTSLEDEVDDNNEKYLSLSQELLAYPNGRPIPNPDINPNPLKKQKTELESTKLVTKPSLRSGLDVITNFTNQSNKPQKPHHTQDTIRQYNVPYLNFALYNMYDGKLYCARNYKKKNKNDILKILRLTGADNFNNTDGITGDDDSDDCIDDDHGGYKGRSSNSWAGFEEGGEGGEGGNNNERSIAIPLSINSSSSTSTNTSNPVSGLSIQQPSRGNQYISNKKIIMKSKDNRIIVESMKFLGVTHKGILGTLPKPTMQPILKKKHDEKKDTTISSTSNLENGEHEVIEEEEDEDEMVIIGNDNVDEEDAENNLWKANSSISRFITDENNDDFDDDDDSDDMVALDHEEAFLMQGDPTNFSNLRLTWDNNKKKPTSTRKNDKKKDTLNNKSSSTSGNKNDTSHGGNEKQPYNKVTTPVGNAIKKDIGVKNNKVLFTNIVKNEMASQFSCASKLIPIDMVGIIYNGLALCVDCGITTEVTNHSFHSYGISCMRHATPSHQLDHHVWKNDRFAYNHMTAMNQMNASSYTASSSKEDGKLLTKPQPKRRNPHSQQAQKLCELCHWFNEYISITVMGKNYQLSILNVCRHCRTYSKALVEKNKVPTKEAVIAIVKAKISST